jgi:ribonuclease P protein component
MSPALARGQRLRKAGEYRRVYDAGGKLVGRYLILFHAPAAEPGPKVGIAVSSKVGGAVARNRQKRRIREALALELAAEETSASGRDMVFVALARIRQASFEGLRRDIASLVKRVRV